jgi:acyl dehydratase
MTDRLSKIESQLGTTHQTVEEFTVEAGKVEEFARGIKSQNPLYRDSEYATDRGYDGVPAPPTFVWSSNFPRYTPAGLNPDSIFPAFDIEYDIDSILYGGQRYEYERPLVVGDTLAGHTTLDDVYAKEGRSGQMIFVIRKTEFTDTTDDLVVTDYKTTVLLEGNRDESSDDESDSVGVDVASMEEYESTVEMSLDEERDGVAETVSEVGDTGPRFILNSVDRMDFVKYGGASGDFSRPHYSLPVAVRAGHSDVFGQGMFSAGFLSNLVVAWFGLDNVRSYEVRFESLVFPGDTLTATGRVADITTDSGNDIAEVSLELVDQNDTTVVSGTSRVALDGLGSDPAE